MLPVCHQCLASAYCLLVTNNVMLLDAVHLVSYDFVDVSTDHLALSAVGLWMPPQIC